MTLAAKPGSTAAPLAEPLSPNPTPSNAVPHRFQFTLIGLMLVVGMIGGVLALGTWIGFIFAISVAAIPFSLVTEWVFVGLQRSAAHEPAKRGAVRTIILLVGAASVSVATWQWISRVPWHSWPPPFLTVLPLVLLEEHYWLALLIPAITFLALSFRDGPNRGPLPMRFSVLLGGAAFWSVGWLCQHFQDRGLEFAWVTLINIAFVIVLGALCWLLRRESTFNWRVAFNALLNWWLFWFAFPCPLGMLRRWF